MSKIKAKWVGGFDAVMPDNSKLQHGVTIVEISEGEARESANWEPVPAKSKKDDKADPSGDAATAKD